MFGGKFRKLSEVSCPSFQGSCNGHVSLMFPGEAGRLFTPPCLDLLLSQHPLCLQCLCCFQPRKLTHLGNGNKVAFASFLFPCGAEPYGCVNGGLSLPGDQSEETSHIHSFVLSFE